MPTPRASARSLAFWITGPSAIGSENGTPSSITSAPAATIACMMRGRAVGVRIAGGDVGDQRLAPAASLQALRRSRAMRLMRLEPAARRASATVRDVLVAAAREVDEQVLVAAACVGASFIA